MTDKMPAGSIRADDLRVNPIKPRRSQDERSGEMRHRLIDAAVRVMAERGFANFRTADVAQVAGVSRGAQVHHFRTRNGLIIAALDAVMKEVRIATEKRSNAACDTDELLLAVAADGTDFFFSERFPMALDMLMSAGKDPGLQADVRAISTSERGSAEDAWAERLHTAGVPLEDAADMVWLMWSVIRGLAVRAFVDTDNERAHRVMSMTLDLLRDEIASDG